MAEVADLFGTEEFPAMYLKYRMVSLGWQLPAGNLGGVTAEYPNPLPEQCAESARGGRQMAEIMASAAKVEGATELERYGARNCSFVACAVQFGLGLELFPLDEEPGGGEAVLAEVMR